MPGLKGHKEKLVEKQITKITRMLLVYESNIREEVEIGNQSKAWEPLTEQEVKRATVGVNTTAPGVDRITVPVLKAV